MELLEGFTTKLVLSSAVVAAIVGGVVTYISQRFLLARKAELDYELEARKRFNAAVGPLRLQLYLSARDVVRRYKLHHSRGWRMEADGYYTKSCIYRLLTPIALNILLEQKLSLIDFALEKEVLDLIRFSTSVERMLTGEEVVMEHPELDWKNQTQHIFRDNLRSAAGELILVDSQDRSRIQSFSEFDSTHDMLGNPKLRDIARLFERAGGNLRNNPVFWARIVGFCYACSDLLASKHAKGLGFQPRPTPVDAMMSGMEDSYFSERLTDYGAVLDNVIEEGP